MMRIDWEAEKRALIDAAIGLIGISVGYFAAWLVNKKKYK